MAKEVKARAVKKDGAAATGKAKVKKDPNAPKRGLSSYMFFSSSQRAQCKEDNPEATFGELGKLLGAQWKEMDEEDKKPYVLLADADKIRYEKAKEAYVPTATE